MKHFMHCGLESTDAVSEQQLQEFWQTWCRNRLVEQLKEEIDREYAEKGYVRIEPRDPVSWLRVALAL